MARRKTWHNLKWFMGKNLAENNVYLIGPVKVNHVVTKENSAFGKVEKLYVHFDLMGYISYFYDVELKKDFIHRFEVTSLGKVLGYVFKVERSG